LRRVIPADLAALPADVIVRQCVPSAEERWLSRPRSPPLWRRVSRYEAPTTGSCAVCVRV